MECLVGQRETRSCFPGNVGLQCPTRFTIRAALERLEHHHRRDHIGRHRRAPTVRREQIGEHLVGEQAVAVLSEERVHRTFPEQMRTQRGRNIEHVAVLADRSGDPVQRSRAQFLRVWACLQRCGLAGAKAATAEMETIVERIGLPYPRWQHALLVTSFLLLAGDADAADAANEHALQLGTAAGTPDAYGVYGGVLANIRRHQGRLGELLDFFLDVARDNPSIAALRPAITNMLCDAGRVDEARERLAVEAANDFDFPNETSWATAMHEFLDAAATAGSHDAARALVDRVTPYATHVVAPAGPLVLGALARPLARAATLLGDHDRAEEWFAIAHDVHDRLQAPYWLACGQLDHAELCLARRAVGDPERARDLVTTAAATAAQYGCAGLTRERPDSSTHSELSGVPPTGLASSQVIGLAQVWGTSPPATRDARQLWCCARPACHTGVDLDRAASAVAMSRAAAVVTGQGPYSGNQRQYPLQFDPVTRPRGAPAYGARAGAVTGVGRVRLDKTCTYCQCDAMSVTKDERLQIRVDPAEKRLLERAAEASHVSVSAFVLQSAAAQAAEVLAERQLIELSPEAAGVFSEALDAPATVNQRLASALERSRKFRWVD